MEDQKIVDDIREYSNGSIDLKVEDLRLNESVRYNNNNGYQRKQNNNQRKPNNPNNQKRKQQQQH